MLRSCCCVAVCNLCPFLAVPGGSSVFCAVSVAFLGHSNMLMAAQYERWQLYLSISIVSLG